MTLKGPLRGIQSRRRRPAESGVETSLQFDLADITFITVDLGQTFPVTFSL